MQLLTFVSLRLDYSKKPSEPKADRSMRLTLASVVGSAFAAGGEVPTPLARRLFESIAISAMQFRGYIHFVRENQVRHAHLAGRCSMCEIWRRGGCYCAGLQ